MSTVENGKYVSFHFKMYTMQGDLIADSEGSEPMSYIHGQMQTEPIGLGEFLEGKEVGFSGSSVLPPEKAFGEQMLSPEESLTQIPLSEFGGSAQKGMMFMANVGDKGEIPMTIMDIQGDVAIVLMGHPLAGYSVRFEVEIVTVRDATAGDIAYFQNALAGEIQS